MGIVSFFKGKPARSCSAAGHRGCGRAAQAGAEPGRPAGARARAANDAAAKAIEKYIAAQSHAGRRPRPSSSTARAALVTVSGRAADQATKEKILLCCGNVQGVASVSDLMTVAQPADESQYHTVVRGDTPRPLPRSSTATPTSTRRSSRPTSRC